MLRHTAPLLALALAAGAAAAQDAPAVSTRADTKAVSLTVYNGDFAVVRERRDIALRPGRNAVRYEDVAARIQAPTVAFKSVTDPAGVEVREQNYQYDVVSQRAILSRAVGQTVRVRRATPDGRGEVVEGILISPPESNEIVLRQADGRVVMNLAGEVEVAALPAGMVSRPSLLWQLDATRGGTHETEVSYITDGLGWSADYVAVVSADDRTADLTGWVTLNNRSGAAYRDAQLQLMAGDVRRTRPNPNGVQFFQQATAARRIRNQDSFAEEEFFEYHLYTLDGRTTLAENETKQMTLLTAPGAGLRRRLVFDSWRAWGYTVQPGTGARTDDVRAAVVLELRNSQANGMGMPLPAGTMRLYKADARGALQFLGEDAIRHTARDEMVRLWAGDAFDVVATRRVVSERKLSEKEWEAVVEVNVRNRKRAGEDDASIVEHLFGDWRITENSHPFEKKDASTAEFTLTVPAGGEATVRYTVRIR